MVKLTLGVLLFLLGVVLGLYVGVWWAFIGGIVQMVEASKADPIALFSIVIGFIRFVFAVFLGYLSAIVCILPSLELMAAGAKEL